MKYSICVPVPWWKLIARGDKIKQTDIQKLSVPASADWYRQVLKPALVAKNHIEAGFLSRLFDQ
jgi:hypothetical protein